MVVLAGGTGGAKLARGMLDVLGADRLTVVANTADDLEIYGAYVSPDPDLVTFWLADRIDERGWGLAGDSFEVMSGLRELGEEVWFNLGDRDLAVGLRRARALDAGRRLTEAQADLTAALGVPATVLPMSDQPVRTRVLTADGTFTLQEFLIREALPGGGWPAIEDVQFRGAENAEATPEVLAALRDAQAIVIGPSNPIISIGPMLAIPSLRIALLESRAPVVAVSPLVQGEVVKGPTDEFMRWRGGPPGVEGIATVYTGLIDGLVADERTDGLPVLVTDVLMENEIGRRRLARETLEFALSLAA